MAVLTQKEYNKKKELLGLSPNKEEKKIRKVSDNLKEITPINNKVESVYEYYLLHPENGADGDMQNFEDIINLFGKDYKRICKNGIVITKEKILAEFLMDKGYLLMEKKKCQ